MPLICPIDHALMTPRFFYGVEIDACPKCGGIWMDDGELAQLGERSDGMLRHIDKTIQPVAPRAEPRPNRQLKCPRDGELMTGYRFAYNSEINLDSCPKCSGVFFDNGELNQIADHKAAEVLRPGFDPEKVRANREKRREAEFGPKDARKLDPEAAIMLATMQGQAARDREQQEAILRVANSRHVGGIGLLGILITLFQERDRF